METRRGTHDDAPAILATVAAGFESYREWAPAGWSPPEMTPAVLERLRKRLSDDEFWLLVALDGGGMIGHVALAPTTREEPAPAPAGAIYLSQMFVRRRSHGSGVAATLMAAAIAEAARRGFTGMRLWTPRGAARARRFYEREGWSATGAVHARSPSGLPTVEYARAVER
ncbi:MAG TPA: GNAT family N-acetyltransferase [Solirubrobacteraceae bacterium]|jgi:GNAT superfamily N-acetyltransferase|nr:GNAT family N-acetyltransferase [Solirubrobacteraceae bacterium]